jgi:uncharacterized protein (DUF362 family)
VKNRPVAILKTSPHTCIDDYGRLLHLANFEKTMNPKIETILKINISWQEYLPSCSTPPWQLDGVLNAMKKFRFDFKKIKAVENITVVTDCYRGMNENKLNNVLSKHGLSFKCLLDGEWEEIRPSKMLVFGKEDMLLPSMLRGSQIIHLPTIKCHGHSEMTCSLKNAFGFLRTVRHHYHLHIHEIIVDLLRIQKEFSKELFSVVDGTIAMDGAGPRIGTPKIKNYIVAGSDMVAVDAVVAKMMGFDPMKIGFIRLAHEEGLGIGDLDQIEIVGDSIKNVNFGFKTRKDPVIYFDRFFRGSPLEPLFFRTSVFKFMVLISDKYRDLWLKTMGQSHIRKFKKTEWGRLFASY